MRFPYLVGQAKSPQPSLSGNQVRHRPIIAVAVAGPAGNWLLDGLLDTGSDDTVFPEWIAAVIGIDLNLAVGLDIHLAGRAKPVRCRYHSIGFRVTDGKRETYEWSAVVGFVAVPLKCPLLGHAGFLQYFDVTFEGADFLVTILPNRSFAGTRT